MVEVADLRVEYGPVVAVDGLTLTVPSGTVLGILGGNGAGKSSTMRALAGVNPPTAGRLIIAGHDMSDPGQAEAARSLIGYCPDVGGLVRQATVREHLALALTTRDHIEWWPQALELLELFGLGEVLDRETHGFSHGMSRRLSVLLAALTSQKVLILDEPFDGVDPTGVDATRKVIADARNAGLAVIVSTHLLSLLASVSDRVAVVAHGTVLTEDDADSFAGPEGEARYARLLRGEVT